MVKVTNENDINFGTITGVHTITHIRVRRQSDNGQPMTTALTSSVTTSAQNALILNSEDLDFNYNNGNFTNAHFRQCVNGYWGINTDLSMKVALLTNANTELVDTGYREQTVSEWTITQDAD